MNSTRTAGAGEALPGLRARPAVRFDDVYRGLLMGAAAVVFFIVFLIAFESFMGSRLSMKTIGWSFLWSGEWDPVADSHIASHYSAADMTGKAANKQALQSRM